LQIVNKVTANCQVMKALLAIFSFIVFISCQNTSSEPKYSDVFTYFDKNTNDTIKFYGYKNLDTAIYYAKKENKNILLIFSGYACMSNSGREWQTLNLYGDNYKIQNNFIITWLAVDDNSIAADTSQSVFWYGKQRKLISVGDQNKYFEEKTFNISTQPLFCFIDTAKNTFGKILGYTRSEKDVKAFLNSGFKNK
jgi:thioredoxin-related protein